MFDAYNNYVFAKPMQILAENAKGFPIYRVIADMKDYLQLYQDARDGKIVLKCGDFTVDQQLWMHLAISTSFLRDSNYEPVSTED